MLVRRLTSSILVVVALVALALVVESVITTLRWRDVFPYYDMILVDYRYFSGPSRDFWLFNDNEHLPLFAMPFFWADLRLFGGQGIFLVTCNLALAAGTALLTWPTIFRAVRADRALAPASAALILLLMLWLGSHADLSWPKQTHMYLSLFATVAAFKVATAREKPSIPAATVVSCWLFVATFSFGYGIIGFAPVLLLALSRRWHPLPVVVVGVTFAVSASVYASLSRNHLDLSQTRALLGRSTIALDYAAAFSAAPAVRFGEALLPKPEALAIGITVMAAGLLAVGWQFLRAVKHPPDEVQALAVMLALFTIGNAIETALSRAYRFGIEGALEYRYIVGELPFWIALVLLGTRALAGNRSAGALLFVGIGAVVVEIGVQHSQSYETGILRYGAPIRWQAAMSALDGVPDRDFFRSRVWPPDPEQVVAVIDGLHAHHLSVFAMPQSSWIGGPVTRLGARTTGCEGELETVRAVADAHGVIVKGWAVDRHVEGGHGWILLADPVGTVMGLAHGGVPRIDLLERRPDIRLRWAGWSGYVRTMPSPGTLQAWLVVPGHGICALGRSRGT